MNIDIDKKFHPANQRVRVPMPMLEWLEKPLVYYADEKLEDGSDGENGLGVSCGNGENEGAGDGGWDGGKWGKDG